jgi:hypothetical protein
MPCYVSANRIIKMRKSISDSLKSSYIFMDKDPKIYFLQNYFWCTFFKAKKKKFFSMLKLALMALISEIFIFKN